MDQLRRARVLKWLIIVALLFLGVVVFADPSPIFTIDLKLPELDRSLTELIQGVYAMISQVRWLVIVLVLISILDAAVDLLNGPWYRHRVFESRRRRSKDA